MRIANVLQHQFAVLKGMSEEGYLATKGVWICTAWYGWDKKNDVVFIAHFDRPFSADSVPCILEAIKDKVPDDHQFESVLIGGKRRWWSPKTRRKIQAFVDNQSTLNITIDPVPIEKGAFKRKDITLMDSSGTVSFDKLKGDAHPKGFIGWFFKPMQDVSKDLSHEFSKE